MKKSITITIKLSGKRLETLRMLSRDKDDKSIQKTASKLLSAAIDAARAGVIDCIAATNDAP